MSTPTQRKFDQYVTVQGGWDWFREFLADESDPTLPVHRGESFSTLRDARDKAGRFTHVLLRLLEEQRLELEQLRATVRNHQQRLDAWRKPSGY